MSIPQRLMRTGLLLGEEGVRNLQRSSVMIVGVGAVGGYALEAVARAGIGHIIVADFDSFDESNINRQILALSSTVGRKKVEVAAERIKEINPECKVEIKDIFVDEKTLPELLNNKVDMVIDAIDSLSSKCCLIEELCRRKQAFISSMGAALRTDPSRIKLSTLDKTQNCGLAKMLRQNLRRREVDIKKIKCVYSDESAVKTAQVNVSHVLGSLPTITAIFGLTIANEVIKTLANRKD